MFESTERGRIRRQFAVSDPVENNFPRCRVGALYTAGLDGSVSRQTNDNLICALPFSAVNWERYPSSVPCRRSLCLAALCPAACRPGGWQRAMERCSVGIHHFAVHGTPKGCGLQCDDRLSGGPACRARQPEYPGRGSLTGESAFRMFRGNRRAYKRRWQLDGERRGAVPQPTLSHAGRPLA